jgi:hypothetical protein
VPLQTANRAFPARPGGAAFVQRRQRIDNVLMAMKIDYSEKGQQNWISE